MKQNLKSLCLLEQLLLHLEQGANQLLLLLLAPIQI
jgi:hypothetical protein